LFILAISNDASSDAVTLTHQQVHHVHREQSVALVCADDPAPDPEHILSTQKDSQHVKKRGSAPGTNFPGDNAPVRDTDTDTGHGGVSDPSGRAGRVRRAEAGSLTPPFLHHLNRNRDRGGIKRRPGWRRATNRKLLLRRRVTGAVRAETTASPAGSCLRCRPTLGVEDVQRALPPSGPLPQPPTLSNGASPRD